MNISKDKVVAQIQGMDPVWISAAVPESIAYLLKDTSQFEISVPAYPDKTFHVEKWNILPSVDQTTRTLQVRLQVSNKDEVLKPGMNAYLKLNTKSQEMLLSARQRLAPWPGARLSLWNADTLAAHAHSADIIWLNNALHRLLPEDPGLLATLQQLAVPGALLYVMECRQLTPSALLSTLLLTNGQPEALLHNSADWAALFSAAAFNCQHGDEVAGLQRFLVPCPDRQVRRDPRQLQAALAGRLPEIVIASRRESV